VDELAGVKVLEIGSFHFSKSHLPDQTTLVWTGVKLDRPPVDHVRLNLLSFLPLFIRLARGDDDVVIVHAEQWAPWDWKNTRHILSLRPVSVALRLAFVQTLRFVTPRKPLIVIDLTEWGFIDRFNEFLLDKCTLYFKRELPFDYWRVFRRRAGGGIPATSFRRRPRQRRRIEKLRPLSIGAKAPIESGAAFPAKSTDVFVALAVENSSTIRADGLRQLRALREAGYSIDIAEERLDFDEFTARMSAAWLTWSPHGFGWDCYRHYEAPLVASVPVISAPACARQFPLIDGKHCFYYPTDEPDGLARTIVAALTDKSRLKTIAEDARRHVRRYHVWPERIELFVRMALGDVEAPGAFSFEDGEASRSGSTVAAVSQ
jgi:hypothetical protein